MSAETEIGQLPHAILARVKNCSLIRVPETRVTVCGLQVPVNHVFMVQIFHPPDNLQHDRPYLPSLYRRWLILDEKCRYRLPWLCAINVFDQIQVAQFHINEQVVSIAQFSDPQNVHDMRVWSSLTELCQVLDFILDHFRFNPRFVNQFPGECLRGLDNCK
jgi:hypothetical protein